MSKEALRQLLNGNATVKLATAGPGGRPWVATAYFAVDDPFALTVLIEARGRTLSNLRENPHCAVMIENGNAMALFGQAEATAREVDERHDAIRDAISKKTPEAAGLVGLPNLVGVRLDVARWRLTDVPAGWLPAREVLPD